MGFYTIESCMISGLTWHGRNKRMGKEINSKFKVILNESL